MIDPEGPRTTGSAGWPSAAAEAPLDEEFCGLKRALGGIEGGFFYALAAGFTL